MKTVTADQAKEKLLELINEVALSKKPVCISGDRSNTVLVSESEWHSVQKDLNLLSQSISGISESVKDVFNNYIDK